MNALFKAVTTVEAADEQLIIDRRDAAIDDEQLISNTQINGG